MTTIKDQALAVLRQLDESPGRRLRDTDGFALLCEPGARSKVVRNGAKIFGHLKSRKMIRPQDGDAAQWQISPAGIRACAGIAEPAPRKPPRPKVVEQPKRRPEPPSVQQPPAPVEIPHHPRGRPVAIRRCFHGVDGGCLACREIEAEVDAFGQRARMMLRRTA